VYAPTSTHDEKTKDEFYDQLQATINKVNKGDICIVMGDLNAKIGRGEDIKCGIGKFGLGNRNESGDRLAEFCHVNNLVITNSLFDHHNRNLYTWISPGDRYRNQIDYIIVNRRWKSSIDDAKTYPGADCETDHILLAAKIRVKPAKIKHKPKPSKVNVKMLDNPSTLTKFKIVSEEKFSRKLSQVKDREAEESSETLWKAYKSVLAESAEETLGKNKRQPKKPWISNEVLELAEEKSVQADY